MEKQTEEKAIEQAVKKCPYKRICKIINGCKCKEIVENKIQDLSISYLADNQAQFLREELEKILQEINDALQKDSVEVEESKQYIKQSKKDFMIDTQTILK